MEVLALIYGDETVWESLQPDERAAAYARAVALTENTAERRFLERRLTELAG